jgi:regulator of cell morphogenesis and NO signaling
MTERLESATVGQIVAADFRAAGVFEQFGIDFCCGGRRLLGDACRTAAADPDALIRALDALLPSINNEDDVTRWPVERLIERIVSTHHTYVRSALPTIARHLARLVEVHGARHPELARVAAYFDQARGDLEQHLLKEEQVLFPYLRDLAASTETCGGSRSPFGTVENPIRMMEREHREVTDALRIIRELTNGYTAPPDGVMTYDVCMAELAQFEGDLHRHVHLENNILFPKAVELEHQAGASKEGLAD